MNISVENVRNICLGKSRVLLLARRSHFLDHLFAALKILMLDFDMFAAWSSCGEFIARKKRISSRPSPSITFCRSFHPFPISPTFPQSDRVISPPSSLLLNGLRAFEREVQIASKPCDLLDLLPHPRLKKQGQCVCCGVIKY